MRKLYRWHWDCGRMGSLEGVFVADEEDVRAAYGRRVYFGKVLGKHSDVHGTLEESEFTILTDDQDFIAKALMYGVAHSGYDPLSYITCRGCGGTLPSPYTACPKDDGGCGWSES